MDVLEAQARYKRSGGKICPYCEGPMGQPYAFPANLPRPTLSNEQPAKFLLADCTFGHRWILVDAGGELMVAGIVNET
jgi:hypothetical protein